MEAEGVKFRTGIEIGQDLSANDLRKRYDAVLIAAGSTIGRDLPVEGRELAGIYQAMDYLPLANRVQEGDLDRSPVHAEGKHVVVIGGGDTGADCLGTAIRQGAASITQLEIMPTPPQHRPGNQPWPTYPMVFRVSSAHEEGGDRVYAASTKRFLGENGVLTGLEIVDVEWVDGRPVEVAGSQRVLPADLVTLAMGFIGPEADAFVDQMGLERDGRGNLVRADDYSTQVHGVYVAGDAGRGQSLIVWAIAEGRAAAASIDEFLMGETNLPKPLPASARQIMV
jgi:glutamate synthase (NADPH/NADH) small chain